MRCFALAALLFTSGIAVAQEPAAPEPPPLPPLPEGALPDNGELPPQVTIRREGGDIIQEYGSQGRVYIVKITPSGGAPYYLIDRNGDGKFETFRNDLEPPDVTQWRVLQW